MVLSDLLPFSAILIETIEQYTDGMIFTMRMKEVIEILSAAEAPKKWKSRHICNCAVFHAETKQ